jgi:hypothetical protein
MRTHFNVDLDANAFCQSGPPTGIDMPFSKVDVGAAIVWDNETISNALRVPQDVFDNAMFEVLLIFKL